MFRSLLFLLTTLTLPASAFAAAEAAEASDDAGTADHRLMPTYMTVRDQSADIDSVAVWHDDHGHHWLLATAKAGDAVRVYNAATGAPIAQVGAADGIELARPNGIAVAHDMAFIVERDHARVTVLALPSLQRVGDFGGPHLERPYGIWIGPADTEGALPVYVTDDYVNADGSRPSGQALDHRLARFRVRRDSDAIHATWVGASGPTAGRGMLRKVESVAGDPAHDRLLLADESPAARNIKVFDLAGQYQNTTIGDARFQHDPEGIALVACGPKAGYWITTEQSDDANRFLVYDRGDLAYRGAFASDAVHNTDGITVTTTPMPNFVGGALFAVNDDGNVAALDLAQISEALGPPACHAANRNSKTGTKTETRATAGDDASREAT